ncbi:Lysosomal cobalamin transporter (LMBRD1) [Diplonema papillatum]|nr:Lysosomal cobalamin transporter (LMBRD1) [Diplonema papillatum]
MASSAIGLGVVFGILVLCSFLGGLRYYSKLHGDYHEGRWRTVVVSSVGFLLAGAKLALLVLDLYDLRYLDSARGPMVKASHQAVDLSAALYVFGVVPFAYAFHSDHFSWWVREDREAQSPQRKAAVSLLLAAPFLLVPGAVVAAGFAEHGGGEHLEATVQNWLNALSGSTQTDRAFQLLSIALSIAAAPVFVCYVGAGLALVPCRLFRGRMTARELYAANEAVDDKLDELARSVQALKSQYFSDLKKPIDKEDKAALRDREKAKAKLEKRKRALQAESEAVETTRRRAARVGTGAAILLFAGFVLAGVVGGRVYALANSPCGHLCVFATESPANWGDVTDAFMAASGYAGTAIVVCLTYTLFAAAAFAMFTDLGVQLFCLAQSVEKVHTTAQACFLSSAFLVLAAHATVCLLPVVHPRSLVFGNLAALGSESDCFFSTFDEYLPNCRMTEIGKSVYGSRVDYPAVAVLDMVVAFGTACVAVASLVWHIAQCGVSSSSGEFTKLTTKTEGSYDYV